MPVSIEELRKSGENLLDAFVERKSLTDKQAKAVGEWMRLRSIIDRPELEEQIRLGIPVIGSGWMLDGEKLGKLESVGGQ